MYYTRQLRETQNQKGFVIAPGAYAGGGGGVHWVHVHPHPNLGKKFRSEMSRKRNDKVPPRYFGKKECARSAQIQQNLNEKVGKKLENSKRKGLKLKK